MSKVSFYLQPDEEQDLEALCSYEDTRLSQRAGMILSYNSTHDKRTTATEFGVSEKTVSNWINRYHQMGIDGLRISHSGQSQTQIERAALTDEKVKKLHAEGVSAKEIANELKTSICSVYRSFDRLGIPRCQKRQTRWSYHTADIQVGNSPYLVGIYLSHDVKTIILCETSEKLAGKTVHGVFSTRNSSLHKEMCQSAVTLRMVDTVVGARNHVSFRRPEGKSMAEVFLVNTIDSWPKGSGYIFHVISMGSVSYAGERITGIRHTRTDECGTWLDAVLAHFNGYEQSDQHQHVAKELAAIKSYIEACTPYSDPYQWKMTYGDYSPLATMLNSPEYGAGIADSPMDLENAMKTFFPNGTAGSAPASGTMIKALVQTQEKDGQLSFREVSTDALLPDIDENNFGTPEGFDRAINELDRQMTTLAHKVDLAGREMYLANVKKKDTH